MEHRIESLICGKSFKFIIILLKCNGGRNAIMKGIPVSKDKKKFLLRFDFMKLERNFDGNDQQRPNVDRRFCVHDLPVSCSNFEL